MIADITNDRTIDNCQTNRSESKTKS